MRLQDISSGMHLSTTAGWNQVDADWRFLFELGSGNNLVALSGKEVVGTITSIPYSDNFYWIGMMLVSPLHRRQGIGSRLIKQVLESTSMNGAFGLDATPLGKKLYDRCGFKQTGSFIRFHRLSNAMKCKNLELKCQPIGETELPGIHTYDSKVFGTNRKHVLNYIWNRKPVYAWKYADKLGVSGFILGRPGRICDHLGPLVANSIEIADLLLTSILVENPQRSFMIDAHVQDQRWISILKNKGFTSQRSLIRMCWGQYQAFGQNQNIFASAGPELG